MNQQANIRTLLVDRTVDVEYEGETFTYWVSLSRAQFERLASIGDTALLGGIYDGEGEQVAAGVLRGWSIGGQMWGDYEFPDVPNREAIRQLPADVLVALAALAGEAIAHSLGELRNRRSRRTTRR